MLTAAAGAYRNWARACGPVVQPEHRGHHARQRGRDAQPARALPVRRRVVVRRPSCVDCARSVPNTRPTSATGPDTRTRRLGRIHLDHRQAERPAASADTSSTSAGSMRRTRSANSSRRQTASAKALSGSSARRRRTSVASTGSRAARRAVAGSPGASRALAPGQGDRSRGRAVRRRWSYPRSTTRPSDTGTVLRRSPVALVRPSSAATCGSARTRTAPAAPSRSARRRRSPRRTTARNTATSTGCRARRRGSGSDRLPSMIPITARQREDQVRLERDRVELEDRAVDVEHHGR